MKHFTKLFNKIKTYNKPWLIIGKGPSFDKLKDINIEDFYSFSLNNSITKLNKVDIAHLIDFDVFEECKMDIIYKR